MDKLDGGLGVQILLRVMFVTAATATLAEIDRGQRGLKSVRVVNFMVLERSNLFQVGDGSCMMVLLSRYDTRLVLSIIWDRQS